MTRYRRTDHSTGRLGRGGPVAGQAFAVAWVFPPSKKLRLRGGRPRREPVARVSAGSFRPETVPQSPSLPNVPGCSGPVACEGSEAREPGSQGRRQPAAGSGCLWIQRWSSRAIFTFLVPGHTRDTPAACSARTLTHVPLHTHTQVGSRTLTRGVSRSSLVPPSPGGASGAAGAPEIPQRVPSSFVRVLLYDFVLWGRGLPFPASVYP